MGNSCGHVLDDSSVTVDDVVSGSRDEVVPLNVEGLVDQGASSPARGSGVPPAPVSPISPMSAKTLSNLPQGEATLEALERHKAYLDRKRNRGKARNSAGSEQMGASSLGSAFLSNVPEVDVDIEYRFVLAIMGQRTKECIAAAAMSRQFLELLPAAAAKESHDGVQTDESDQRLLCTVPYPAKMLSATKRLKVCKLIVRAMGGSSDVPRCRNRFEALSTCLVFSFVVDPKDGQRSFAEQLEDFENAIDNMRSMMRKLRCARCVLFVREGPKPSASEGKEKWEFLFDEFELVHGGMWKFGPVQADDCEELYSVFATAASSRLLRLQESQGTESDGSHCSELPPVYEAEVDERRTAETEGRTLAPQESIKIKHSWLTPMQIGAA